MVAARAVTKRSIQLTSSQHMRQLKQIQLKPNTRSNMNWGVSAYNRWSIERLSTNDYDVGIYFADIMKPESLEKMNLCHSLCYFIPEVTKKSGEYFPGKTLYLLVVAIQKYLPTNKIRWRLIEDSDFSDVKIILDNVMKERAALNLGLVSRADIITYEMEEQLWQKNLLGVDTPDKLRTTCYFYLGLRFFLRSIEDHYQMRCWTPSQESQLSFKTLPNGKRVLIYEEDSVTKTHDGGLKDRGRDRKKVELHSTGGNPDRDPVAIIDKYLGLCPPFYEKSNFYLQSLKKPTLAQWYGYQVLGEKSIGKIIPDLMESAGIKGYFTGHSLRRSGTTHLLNAGVDKKILKECTGYMSDAIDKYMVTSDVQREKISDILTSDPINVLSSIPSSLAKVRSDVLNPANKTIKCALSEVKDNLVNIDETVTKCNCNSSNVGSMIDKIISDVSSKGKTSLKITIEINKE